LGVYQRLIVSKITYYFCWSFCWWIFFILLFWASKSTN